MERKRRNRMSEREGMQGKSENDQTPEGSTQEVRAPFWTQDAPKAETGEQESTSGPRETGTPTFLEQFKADMRAAGASDTDMARISHVLSWYETATAGGMNPNDARQRMAEQINGLLNPGSYGQLD